MLGKILYLKRAEFLQSSEFVFSLGPSLESYCDSRKLALHLLYLDRILQIRVGIETLRKDKKLSPLRGPPGSRQHWVRFGFCRVPDGFPWVVSANGSSLRFFSQPRRFVRSESFRRRAQARGRLHHPVRGRRWRHHRARATLSSSRAFACMPARAIPDGLLGSGSYSGERRLEDSVIQRRLGRRGTGKHLRALPERMVLERLRDI